MEHQTTPTFSNLLRAFRNRAGFTREEVAGQAALRGRVSTRTIKAWETGENNPRYREDVLLLAEALGLSHVDTDNLLLAAGYHSEYATETRDLSNVTHVEKLHVDELVISKQQAPPGPIPAPPPEPRARKFVGRLAEKESLRLRLEAGKTAAVAGLRGIGGIGKTELAIAITHELAGQFPGGVYWLECGARDVAGIQERLAEALGMAPLAGAQLESRAAALRQALAAREPALLALDDIRRRHLADFEHLRPPANCALLVTSRRYDLPLPPGDILKLDTLPLEDGKRLFAALLGPMGVVPQQAWLAPICQLLENIPLALRLAARRAARLARQMKRRGSALEALHTELQERRLAALAESDERPDLSIRLTFDLSYEDLDADDQRRLRALGVFARNALAPAAMAAVWQEEKEAARAALQRLENAGLIEEEAQESWWLHDLLREYAAEYLDQADAAEENSVRLSHAAFWANVIGSINPRAVADWEALTQFGPEVEKAANWLMPNWKIDPQVTSKLAYALGQQSTWHTHPNIVNWLRLGLSAAEDSGDRRESSNLQYFLAYLLSTRGQYDEAERLYRLSLQTKEQIGDSREVAVTQSSLADLLSTRGQYDEAERLYRLSLQTFEQIGDSRSVAVTQSSLADLLSTRGQYDEAERLYRLSLQTKEQIGDSREVAVTQSSLADLLSTRGQYDEAERLYRLSLQTFEQIGDSRSVAVTQSSLADLLSTRGQYDEAERLYRLSLQTKEQIGDSRSVAVTQSSLADLLRTRGQYDEAERLYRLSLQTKEQIGDSRSVAVTQSSLADLLRTRGQVDEAEALLKSGYAIVQQVRDLQGIGVFAMQLGQMALLGGEREQAVTLFQQAHDQFMAIGLPNWAAQAQQLLDQAQGGALTLDDLMALVRAGRTGDQAQGQQAWDICLEMQGSQDAALAALGTGLLQVLAGVDPAQALAKVDADLRQSLVRALGK